MNNTMNDNTMNDNTMNDKKINIIGTNNRYKMKKVMKTDVQQCKKREVSSKWGIAKNYFEKNTQLALLELDNTSSHEKKILLHEIEQKLKGYKYQDCDKNIYNEEFFISLDSVLKLLTECKLVCDYCKQDVFILYEIVRETKQWTLDRIDNSMGHNEGNVVISCLSCNLQRRCQNKDKFSFTKQLKIHRDKYLQ